MSTTTTTPSSSFEVAKARLQTITAQIEAALETKLQERKAALEGTLKEARRRVAAIDKAKAHLDDVDRRVAENEQAEDYSECSDVTVKLKAERKALIEKLLVGLPANLDDGQETVDISDGAKKWLRDLKGELESALAEVAKREQILDGINARASEIDQQIEAEAILENDGKSSGRLPMLSAERTAIPARITAAERSLERAVQSLSPILDRSNRAGSEAMSPVVDQAKTIIAAHLAKYFTSDICQSLAAKSEVISKMTWMGYMMGNYNLGIIEQSKRAVAKIEALLSGPFPLNWR